MTDIRQVRSYPFSDPDRLDLHPLYARLRREEPVARVRLPFGEAAWLATRYRDVKMVLGDPRFSRAASVRRDEPRITAQRLGSGILAMDPPDHSRLRRLAAKALTARRVELLRPATAAIAGALIDAMRAAGPPADLVDRFATPLPVLVICRLLGVPASDHHLFRTWSEALTSTSPLASEVIVEYLGRLHAYLAGLIAQRREEPADDLITALAQARDEDNSRLTEPETVELAAGLLAAGHETTVAELANAGYVLLTQPEQFALLRARPELVPRAVEELLRYVPLGAAAFARYATEDLELGGVHIQAGEPVIAALSSANRDAAVFANPDRLDVTRPAGPHIGFGHGVHYCLGAQLARMELQVALGALVEQLPHLALAVDEKALRWQPGLLARGPRTMPVTW